MRTILIAIVTLGVLLGGGLVRAADNKPTTSSGPTEYNGKSLKQWVEEINPQKQRDPGLRVRAIQAITVFDPDLASKEASSILVEAIDDGDTSIRVNALIALALIGVHDSVQKKALHALTRQLNEDSQGIVRLHAAVVIGTMDTAGRAAIPALIYRSKDLASYEIRKQCIIALGRVGQMDEKNSVDMKAVNALIGVVAGNFERSADSSAEVRLSAVMALGGMGVPATPAEKQVMVTGLQNALKDPQKIIQIWARVSLMKVDGVDDKHIAGILEHIRGKDATCKVEAIRALGFVGPKAMKQAYKEIVELLNDKDQGLVANAAWALGEWGEAAEDALPALEKVYASKDLDERLKPVIRDAIDGVKGKKKN
ncbi:MAG TPA: HEAT repeat domain-containing protein [Gemmataceae bacterium]|nr:HEAT repeat domain-containing protein [Gemmataceae bacterium]